MTDLAVDPLNTAIIGARCPENHVATVAEILDDAGPVSAALVNHAFAMITSATTTAWLLRSHSNQPLTHDQFHDLVRNRHFGQVFRRVIEVRADYDWIGDIVENITAALAEDPQLNP
ncbi:hypothetical protein [Kitasatospora sp. NPDC015120]|uniref:hypothetical protein n=1 Tax=Kitasatospora sp. NPDC015120 TaxID=3364023 RepID=UPI0036F4A339